jgi:antitoxin YefM
VITKDGHPAAVIISLDDLESLEETLDVMDGAALLDDIREALADSDAPVLSKEEASRLITDRRARATNSRWRGGHRSDVY